MTRRNRRPCFSLLTALLVLLSGMASPFMGADAQIREYVQVNQIELIVRVQNNRKQPVTGLTKKDFSLKESGNPVEVTSCLEVKRRINEKGDSTHPESFRPPRLFLVYFWVWQDSELYQRYLDYLFDHIFREGDTIILSQPADTRVIQNPNEISSVRRQFEKDLQNWTRRQSRNMESIVENLESIMRDFIANERLLSGQPGSGGFMRALNVFKSSVMSEWKAFRSSFLDIPNRNFKRLANLLSTIKHQKWALVLMQPSTFPTIHPNALLWTRLGNTQQEEALRNFALSMIRMMNTPHEPSTQMISIGQSFIRANATFHIIRMDTRKDETDKTPDLAMREVFSDRQTTFQHLSRITGGQDITDNMPERAIKRIASAEDIYYRLTYRPAKTIDNESRDKRHISIIVNRPGVTVHYARKLRLSEVEEIHLAEFHCDSTRLKFILTGYAVRMDQEQLQSDVSIHVTAESPRGEEMSFSRHFDTQEPFLEVSMALNFPHSGSYRLRFQAEDRFTGMSVAESQIIQVIMPETAERKSSGEKNP